MASDEEVLEAFRRVTGWPDELVLHYALDPTCECIPICGYGEDDCPEAQEIWQTAGGKPVRSAPPWLGSQNSGPP